MSSWKTAGIVGASLALLCAGTTPALAQNAGTLAQVKKVYVGSFAGKEETGGSEIRERMIQQLRRSGKLKIVPSPTAADAVIRGSGQIWVKGYISSDAHSPVNGRQPVYGGFLSVEVIGKDNQILWSYLVTPGRFPLGSIAHDLADRVVKQMLVALAEESPKGPAFEPPPATAKTMLHGAGATFPAPLYQEWSESFQQGHPGLHISYDAIGSDAGIERLVEGNTDFAASDAPLSDQRMSQLHARFLHFASVLGAVVPIYNLAGLHADLRFTPEALAGIYLGKIRKWNDPMIRASNRGAELPDSGIVVVHRSDGSGTSFVWTDYLSKISPEWKAAVGSDLQIKWPTGVGAERNEGVAAMVQRTPNSIGYVELIYAIQHHLSFGAVRNAAGQFIQADLISLTAAAASTAGKRSSDFRTSITDAPGKAAYPIASFTWLLFPAQMDQTGKKTALVELLEWALTSGQKQCSVLGYAPLPREIVNQELQALHAWK